jgi:tRNA-2-methylthio-N6-dimethylallyladenosine synthase
MMQPGKRVFIETYGCQMNVYDSERMRELLAPIGYGVAESLADADLVILNTCHIREKATEKVYSELGRVRNAKEARKAEGRGETRVIVAGCVAQAEGEEIIARAPVVDFVVGPQAYHRLPELLARDARARGERVAAAFQAEAKFDELGAARAAQGVSAFLSIQEGCDKFCSFCVVPYTRGAEYSRPAAAILAEARALAASGARELVLLGQNVNAYHGAGLDGATLSLAGLLRLLAPLEGVSRLRFTTSHPSEMDAELIALFGAEPKLAPYLHLPVQSGSDAILAAMNRKHTAQHYLDTVAALRQARPDLALSTDLIVGFPGETDADFEATMALVEAVGFASAYSFKYSRRPGTPAAAMRKQVAEEVKAARLARLQALLARQQAAFNAACVGRTLSVLVTGPGRKPGQMAGRSPYLQAVHFDGPATLLGQEAAVVVESASQNSLAGRLEGE